MHIAQVVARYGVNADTLRCYERVGLLPHIRRNASGIRECGEEDCGRISFVKCMRGAILPKPGAQSPQGTRGRQRGSGTFRPASASLITRSRAMTRRTQAKPIDPFHPAC